MQNTKVSDSKSFKEDRFIAYQVFRDSVMPDSLLSIGKQTVIVIIISALLLVAINCLQMFIAESFARNISVKFVGGLILSAAAFIVGSRVFFELLCVHSNTHETLKSVRFLSFLKQTFKVNAFLLIPFIIYVVISLVVSIAVIPIVQSKLDPNNSLEIQSMDAEITSALSVRKEKLEARGRDLEQEINNSLILPYHALLDSAEERKFKYYEAIGSKVDSFISSSPALKKYIDQMSSKGDLNKRTTFAFATTTYATQTGPKERARYIMKYYNDSENCKNRLEGLSQRGARTESRMYGLSSQVSKEVSDFRDSHPDAINGIRSYIEKICPQIVKDHKNIVSKTHKMLNADNIFLPIVSDVATDDVVFESKVKAAIRKRIQEIREARQELKANQDRLKRIERSEERFKQTLNSEVSVMSAVMAHGLDKNKDQELYRLIQERSGLKRAMQKQKWDFLELVLKLNLVALIILMLAQILWSIRNLGCALLLSATVYQKSLSFKQAIIDSKPIKRQYLLSVFFLCVFCIILNIPLAMFWRESGSIWLVLTATLFSFIALSSFSYITNRFYEKTYYEDNEKS